MALRDFGACIFFMLSNLGEKNQKLIQNTRKLSLVYLFCLGESYKFTFWKKKNTTIFACNCSSPLDGEERSTVFCFSRDVPRCLPHGRDTGRDEAAWHRTVIPQSATCGRAMHFFTDSAVCSILTIVIVQSK